MKNVYLIGGAMGVGKTATCQILKNKLPNCVFLDGDWCWDMHPFEVIPETKKMVMENICFLLNQFIRCSAYENIIFCWVMHEQGIIDEIISKLETEDCQIYTISLMCDADVLRKRLQKDIDAGIRSEDVIQRSIARIGLYEKLDTEKIDISHITPEQAAERIINGEREEKRMQKRLSDRVADDILTMIVIEKRFLPGEKLPNEIELSGELEISRTTLREAFRILVANGVVEIRRGLGTFVREDFEIDKGGVPSLADIKTDIRDLYEMRLIVEPEAAYYAAMRASDEEIGHILRLGQQIEEEIAGGKDRTETERNFHKAIAKAAHNEFMTKLLPVIYQAIDKGVQLSKEKSKAVSDTIQDHKTIMEFLRMRNGEGARSAMKIHILHAMEELNM